MPKVLLVEDNVETADSLSIILESNNFSVAVASTGLEAFRMLLAEPPHVVVLDLTVPELNPPDFVNLARKRGVQIILFSGACDLEARRKRLGLQYAISKPCDLSTLVEKLRQITSTSAC